MTLSNFERVKKFYSNFNGDDQVLVIINADPDAMSSAMAVKRLLWRKVASTKISCINRVKRSDNLAMIRLLGIKMIYVDEIDKSRFNKIVMVDSQPGHSEKFNEFKPDVIIDHHPDENFGAAYSDIRPEYGATATMLTEYLKAAKIKPSVKLATALYYGIKTDTSNFQRKTLLEDIKAFQYLFKFANIQLEKRIEQAEIPLGFLKYYEKAFNLRVMKGNRLYVHLGEVPTPDICVQIADFFMNVDKVNWTIVSGNYDEKVIVIIRNDGIRKNAGKVADSSFGEYGSAGGHRGMARAEIPYESIEDSVSPRNQRKLELWIRKHIEIRTARKVKKE
ncbi:MAG: phosphoesterase [Deltaproteobacteria bacterium]|nr:MAG: phosphoesterase [Deltaproteobacteria bacterium]PIE74994.1 MAG: phosphoesterase [Deltaproteobacteria bacterium]